jgi:hypothetical protein
MNEKLNKHVNSLPSILLISRFIMDGVVVILNEVKNLQYNRDASFLSMTNA